ncbi:MAG: efflux RND transporter periplasmic adaptor subunit [Bacteroidales bacterium]
MKKIIASQAFRYAVFLVIGLILGRIFFHPAKKPARVESIESHEKKPTIWTCSMHPQFRMNKPGKCPICGMDLIPLEETVNVALDSNAVVLTPQAIQLANIHTTLVSRTQPIKEIRLYGKVQADERLIQSQVAHLPGRVEKLLVNFTGERVAKGQVLALLYSSELITAQQELLEASKMKAVQPEIYAAARERLLAWKLSQNQIDQIEQSGKIQTEFPILANTSGVVTALRVRTGDHVAEGSVLFEVVDLSHVWILFDAYESDLPFLQKGNRVTFTVQAIPGRTFESTIVFIDPTIDPVTRVAKIRAERWNHDGLLKPEMFVTGIVKTQLPGVTSAIVIPRSSVLWTGKRSIVYVKIPGSVEPAFRLREITLGPSLGNSYIIEDGLFEGEEIVTEGTFSVDAAAQLAGKPSMMNPVEQPQKSDHQHMHHHH